MHSFGHFVMKDRLIPEVTIPSRMIKNHFDQIPCGPDGAPLRRGGACLFPLVRGRGEIRIGGASKKGRRHSGHPKTV